MKLSPRQFVLPAIAGIAGIIAWYAVHFALSEDMRFVLPTPGAIWDALRENGATLVRATFNTGAGALVGFAAATTLSAGLAIAMSVSTSLRAGVYPYLMILQMTPVVVIAPILVLWIDSGFVRVAVITVLVCFFPIAVNTTQGLISTDRTLVDLFRMWRATRWQQLVHLRIPAALPYFFAGLRIAAVLAPIGALVGDYTAGSSGGNGGGLGFQAIVYSSQAQYPALFATAAVTCALGFVFTGGVIFLSWLTLHRWHDAYEPRG
jgi:NitT/TauT family transport system permease protein